MEIKRRLLLPIMDRIAIPRIRSVIELERTTGQMPEMILPVENSPPRFHIPLEMIQECIELSKDYKAQMHGNEFINLRDSILPILNIREYFKEEESKTDRDNIMF